MPDVRLGAAVLGILAVILLASVDQLYRFTLWLYGKLGWSRLADGFEKSKKLWTYLFSVRGGPGQDESKTAARSDGGSAGAVSTRPM